MKTIGIFFGSSTGNTQDAAQMIAEKLGTKEVFDIAKASADQFTAYDVLILGTSTWGVGDLQDDWDGFVNQLKKQNLSGKTVAVFGCGDSSSYSDTFCNAMGILAQTVKGTGARLVGSVDPSGYEFDDSEALVEGRLVGLALDFDNEGDKTEQRINDWAEQIKEEIG